MKQADIKIILRPGTDGAFACGVMHVLFREGYADREYLERYTDCPEELEAHLATRTPEWASSICGVPVEEIEDFARAGRRDQSAFFRLGYGFTRSRNGAAKMHAALAFRPRRAPGSRKGVALSSTMPRSGSSTNPSSKARTLSTILAGTRPVAIGAVLTGEPRRCRRRPVKAMLIQNTNPMTVAPEQKLVRQGFAREDLFMVVHEQFMTETAADGGYRAAGDDVHGA